MITFGLCMIVKNEADIIERCLTSMLPHIDCYSIVDTGSTDGTQDIIRKFFAKHGIPGQVYDLPWKGFGKSRSDALKLCDGKMDYAWVIDADEVIREPTSIREFVANLPTLPDCFLIEKFSDNGITYWNTQIFKTGQGWRYEGVLHEYATDDRPISCHNQVQLELITQTSNSGGARSKNPKKYEDDVKLLLRGLAEEPDNARYVFYLARSYDHIGDKINSVKRFKQRIAMGGWIEEVWYSMYQISVINHDKDMAWASLQYWPNRIEGIFEYVREERLNRRTTYETYAMINLVARTSMPNCHLFLDPSIYNWRALYLLAFIAFDVGHRKKCKKTVDTLLNDRIKFLGEEEIGELKNLQKMMG